ncbi:hypothetical protein J3458_020018 [Metarhizium acridum]|uniref:uncharacterized protein n=1 Tax=Metarhizium acridum TaxID=92637 RepID=UPI001C6CD30C|nr:hypothetical protein J3458_020018 [Metarhizium acridum]
MANIAQLRNRSLVKVFLVVIKVLAPMHWAELEDSVAAAAGAGGSSTNWLWSRGHVCRNHARRGTAGWCSGVGSRGGGSQREEEGVGRHCCLEMVGKISSQRLDKL